MTHIRVGNEEYVRQNHSFGLTTLRARHVEVAGASIRFEFRGKGGVRHVIEARDRRLAEIVKRCQDLPGQELFQYLDDQDVRHPVGSTQVNEYVRQITQQDFTAKDFRTWSATVIAVASLRECGHVDQKTQAKRNVMQALRHVAERLGNTVAICRKCYVHPAVIEAYLDGATTPLYCQPIIHRQRFRSGRLTPLETGVLRFLEQLRRSEKRRLRLSRTAG